MTSISGKTIAFITAFAVVKLVIHLFGINNYGLHADELYYVALSKHLQWGYPDNGPLVPFITRLASMFFGESAFAFRIIPVVVSAATVYVTGLIAYHLGGRGTAIGAACLAVVCSPALLATSYILQPVVFEHCLWTLTALLLIRYLQTERSSYAYMLAVVVAVGILNKYTILLYLAALLAGLFLSGRGRAMFCKKLLWPALLCLLLISPNLIWEAMHHFPAVNYVGIVTRTNAGNTVAKFVIPFIFFHGAGVAVWLAGLGLLLLDLQLRRYRFIAWAFLITTLAFVLLQGKIYYGLGAFPPLFAAGGVCWEMMLRNKAAIWRWALWLLLVLPAVIALPVVVPVLPLGQTQRYLKLMLTYTNITQPLAWQDGRVHPVPQTYADMLGWQEMNDIVSQAAASLNPAERKNTVILAEDYGVAGALAVPMRDSGMAVISPNNSFVEWSPDGLNTACVIYVTDRPETEVLPLAEEVKFVGIVQDRYARCHGYRVYLLKGLSASFKAAYIRQRQAFLGIK